MKHTNLVDFLLDDNNTEPLILSTEKGGRFSFEKIAVIPHEKELYVIMRPLYKIEGMKENEAIVCKLVGEGDDRRLDFVEDQALINLIFQKYYEVLNFQVNHLVDQQK